MRVSTISKAASGNTGQRSGRPRTAALVAVAVGMVLALSWVHAQAATIIVNSTADDTSAGHCTLREAINSANGASSDIGTCTAGDGDDTIEFSVSGTIALASSLPQVVRTLTVQGPTASPSGIMVDGGDAYQVMVVSSGAVLQLANLTIEDGFVAGSSGAQGYGAGILNNGTLAVINSAFSNNTAGRAIPGVPLKIGNGGGIANYGTLTVTGSTFSHNAAIGIGGGILNYRGALTVTNSTFSGNTAGSPPRVFSSGGGIFNLGTLAVSNSTFSANSANIHGGGIGNSYGTVTVTNSTFFSNVAVFTERGTLQGLGGGISNVNGGTMTVTSSTLARNTAGSSGGGINNRTYLGRGSSNLRSTILADNSISGDDTPDNCGGDPITDAQYNISDDDSCDFTQETSANSLDPRLDPTGLNDNAGPTETIALQANSPAIDLIPLADCVDQASPPNRISTDQRGALRPDPGEVFCDVGAYEFQDFAGQANCHGKSVSALAQEYGGLAAAASAYGFSSVKALQGAIRVSCISNAVARQRFH